METVLKITSGRKILLMWDISVINGMIQGLIDFSKDTDYNIMMM